ncbi:Xaa-Pro peptidase family protein [Acuticoccus sp. MNP-M23]|uniref:Xaa-Pro peptidase family protein n=1 Tax=Acuticoccus sp. MNP-M23 TaxID=3072793 RepID=UPI0028151249|nr:Xaa-Pro peptidase family protein [Acuticoccus sp. MNP-M23]WMS43600.1 Xaa-Pro peptidase family protein [Acuticoccus sp. MNP-M23]
MAPPFSRAEYAAREAKVAAAVEAAELDALLVTDPSSMNWLTGYDAWSFYMPQMVVFRPGERPLWLGRMMDSGATRFTTYIDEADVRPYPDTFVHRDDRHPGDHMAGEIEKLGLGTATIGYESDGHHFTPRTLDALRTGLPNARFTDANLVVNWCRLVKSPAELRMMREAATLAGLAMQAAFDHLRPGVRQASLMAEVVAAQLRGTAEFGGDLTAVHPLVMPGDRGSTAHPLWDDEPFVNDRTIGFELGGCRRRYNAGLARTAHLGKPPQTLLDTAAAVEEGMDAVLASLKAGVMAQDVHAAWQRVLDKHGLEKESRIGYSIGVGYGPDWGERTLSFRPGATVTVPENAVVHIILGMWMADWGMEISETIHVRENDAICLTSFPRDVHVVE